MPTCRRLVAALLLAATCSSCTNSDEARAAESVGEVAAGIGRLAYDSTQVSYRWYAGNPSIDLDAPEIEVARAWIASDMTFSRTGDSRDAYPGFSEPGRLSRQEQEVVAGTIHLTVVAAERFVDNAGRNRTGIMMCVDKTELATENGTRWKVIGHGSIALNISVMDRWNPPSRTGLDGARRLPFPTWDVFEGWEVHGYGSGFPPGYEWSIYCDENVPTVGVASPNDTYLTEPPPVRPHTPGWPTAVTPGARTE